MNGLGKWFIKHKLKKLVTNASVKDAVHDLNAQFAEKVRIEGKEKVADVTSDVMRCISARLDGFADDGRITGGELAAINTTDDEVIDKYLSDAQIDALIERLFDNANK